MTTTRGRLVPPIISEEREVRRLFHGTIQGVAFDLRSAGIGPREWACPPLLEAAAGHPGFHFVSPPHARTLLSNGDDEAEEAAKRGEIVVRAGAKVTVGRVEDADSSDELAVDADRRAVVLHLVVTDPAGHVSPGGTLHIGRRGHLGEEAGELETLWRLGDRLGEARGGDLDELKDLRARVQDRLKAVRQALRTAEVSDWGLLGPSDGQPRFAGMFEADVLANLSALYGYRQARAEQNAKGLKALAGRTLARQKINRRAGTIGASKRPRVAFAQTYWSSHPQATAAEAARAYCAQHPDDGDDVSSVARSIRGYAPPTSPTFSTRGAAKARARIAQATDARAT